jgi:flagellar basal-body rod protein FlgG
MILGFYAGANGMMAVEHYQDVIANNIANSATPGYRRQAPIVKGFNQVMLDQLRNPVYLNNQKGPGGGLQLDETFDDMRPGALNSTGSPLDVAVQGEAFIGVDTDAGERFTRSGQFQVNAEGMLTTPDGHLIQNVSGQGIPVADGDISIGPDGSVSSNGEIVGQIRMVKFEEPRMLDRVGDTLYAASENVLARSAAADDSTIVWKSLEASNVQVAEELVRLTMGLRAYQANQRSIASANETVGRLIEQVGMP